MQAALGTVLNWPSHQSATGLSQREGGRFRADDQGGLPGGSGISAGLDLFSARNSNNTDNTAGGGYIIWGTRAR